LAPAWTALTRSVSPSLARCELTHIGRTPIDVKRATQQHEAYEAWLREHGCTVRRLDELPDSPDSVFVEDTAVIFDELAILTRPGACSRRAEVDSTAAGLQGLRALATIEAPGTCDGGDVLVIGHQVFVGLTSRTNRAAIDQMGELLQPHGYAVQAVQVTGCLHLKSAASAIGPETLLVAPDWVDTAAFKGWQCLDIDPAEPQSANALLLDDKLLLPSAFPRTAERAARAGCDVSVLDLSELARAEGALTCCSLLLRG
jgi:dimethylargininase